MSFLSVPIYNASLQSEERIINSSFIEEIKPHADVPVSPGPVSTPSCEVRFYTDRTVVVLIDFGTMKDRLNAVEGIVTVEGNLL